MANIVTNPINLRIASDSEKAEAFSIINNRFLPDHVLVSETAFPGQMSYYRGIIDADGNLDSAGWIGKL